MSKATTISLILRMHQPVRLIKYNAFKKRQINLFSDYFESPEPGASSYLKETAARSYYPFNELLKSMLDQYPDFSFTLCVSGTMLEQLAMLDQELLKSLSELTSSKQVDVAAQSYHNSFSWEFSAHEYADQIREHRSALWQYLKVRPDFLFTGAHQFDVSLAGFARALGYQGVFARAGDRNPFTTSAIAASDDLNDVAVEYRFSARTPDSLTVLPLTILGSIQEYTAKSLVEVIAASGRKHTTLMIDYDSLTDAQTDHWITLMEELPEEMNKQGVKFVAPSTFMSKTLPREEVTVNQANDPENKLQREALTKVYEVESLINKLEKTYRDQIARKQIKDAWRKLQTVDHFKWMATEGYAKGEKQDTGPYDSPYDAYINYMNVLQDFTAEVKKLAER